MKVDDFDFELPAEFIAQRPASPRDSARLLVAEGLTDRIMRDLPDFLNKGDILVFNDTRVIPARLKGKRDAANIEVTLHKRENDDTWKVFAKPAKKLSYKVQRELDQLPAQVETMEAEIAALQQAMAQAEFYTQDQAQVSTTLAHMESLETALEQAMDRWLELEAD